MKNIGQEAIRALALRMPPFAEQTCIASRLQAHDRRSRRETAKVAKLRLLKNGLMDDLLTGKVRVTPLLDEST